MKLENIEEARILIAKRNNLLDVLDKSEKWNSAHFELVEHCGHAPGRIPLCNFQELFVVFLDAVRDNVKIIEERLEEL